MLFRLLLCAVGSLALGHGDETQAQALLGSLARAIQERRRGERAALETDAAALYVAFRLTGASAYAELPSKGGSHRKSVKLSAFRRKNLYL